MGFIIAIIVIAIIVYLFFKPIIDANLKQKNIEELPVLSSLEIKHLQSTWMQVVTIKTQAAELFYGRLFELDPSVKPLFTKDMKEQGDQLIATIAKVVNSVDRLDRVTPLLEELAKRHIEYGVTVEHYATVGEALLWTLQQGLGDGFTEEVEQAWIKAYGLISKTMINSAY